MTNIDKIIEIEQTLPEFDYENLEDLQKKFNIKF